MTKEDDNNTQRGSERLHDHDETRIIVEALPALLTMVERFRVRAAENVAYEDLLDHAGGLLVGIDVFAGDLLKATDPLVIAGLRGFEASSHLGWVALARCAALEIISKHPDVLRVATEQAHEALWRALTGADGAFHKAPEADPA